MLAYGGIALFLSRIQSDIGLTFTQAGTLSAVSTLVYALMQIPAGYMADRFGAKRVFLIGLLGVNLLSLSFAFLPSYELLLVNQAISGFFRALLFAPGLVLITSLFPPARRATAMGLYVAGGSSSSIFLNAFGPLLIGALGWRNLFIIFSFFGLGFGLLYWRFGVHPTRLNMGPPITFKSIFELFKYRAMWLVGGIQYVRLSVALGIQFWLPTFLVAKGYSLEVAGLIVAISFTATAPANFLGGYISDRLQSPLLVIGSSLGVLAFTTFLLVNVNFLPLLIGVIILNGIFVQFYFGPLFAVPHRFLGSRMTGATSGFGNLFANLGGFTFTYTIGAVKDATGSFAGGFYSLTGLCLLGVFLTFLLARLKPVSTQTRQGN
jgi:nitrate/nitrite transporter NarK